MKAAIFSIVMIFAIFGSANAEPQISEYEMPLGVFTTYSESSVNGDMLDSLHDTLGFNFAYVSGGVWSSSPYVDEDRIRFYHEHGIHPVVRMLKTYDDRLNEAYRDYEKSHYVKIESEDDESLVRFIDRPYGGQDGDWWSVPVDNDPVTVPYVVLDSLTYNSCKGVSFRNEEGEMTERETIYYYPAFKLWVDSAVIGDTILELRVTLSSDASFLEKYPIISDSSFYDNDTIKIEATSSYHLTKNGKVNFQIVSFNNAGFGIDWFKVYDNYGKYCVEENRYDQRIINYVTQPWCNEMVMNWYLRDEPEYDQMLPYAHIDSVIRAATYSAFGDTTYGITSLIGGSAWRQRCFVGFDNPQVIWGNKYPYTGKYAWPDGAETPIECQTACAYAGDGQLGYLLWGLQRRLRLSIAKSSDSMRTLAESTNKNWWMSLQTWRKEYYNFGLNMRWPTQSELCCQAYMAMCYNVKGFACYTYLGSDETPDPGRFRWDCIRYADDGSDTSYAPSHLWHAFHDRLSPYIKAIDSTYLSLNWYNAYHITPTEPSTGLFIDTIEAHFNDPDSSSPDLGWFHVGEYTIGRDVPSPRIDNIFFMLVNRACSQDIDDPSEAGSITADIHLYNTDDKPDNAFVIDIAHEVAYNDTTGEWEAIPETTFVSNEDNVLSYITVLKAGEGRLFEVVPVDTCYITGTVSAMYDTSLKLENVLVSLKGGWPDSCEIRNTYTDSLGNFTFSGFPYREHSIQLYYPHYKNVFIFGIYFTEDNTEIINAQMRFPCIYKKGDINCDSLVMGSDVIYGVRYFKGYSPPPCSCWNSTSESWLYVGADANGDCSFIGSDITRLVNYFGGSGNEPSFCPQVPSDPGGDPIDSTLIIYPNLIAISKSQE